MNTPNVRELINKLPICAEGKVGVVNLINLVAPAFKVELPAAGEVWLTNSERIVVVYNGGCVQIDDIFPFEGSDTSNRNKDELKAGFHTTNGGSDKFNIYWHKRLAASPAEYFANKESILAKIKK